jgi:hypothetical protein
MSYLSLKSRPVFAFDAKNTVHIKYYANFVKTKTWGHCPIKFVVSGTTDLISHIENEMIDYYVKKEFRTKNNWHQK